MQYSLNYHLSGLERIYEILFIAKIEVAELIDKKHISKGCKEHQKRLDIAFRKIKIAEKLINDNLTRRGILIKKQVSVIGVEMELYELNKNLEQWR